ncbi:SDR family oxidoreductase [Candidatus Acetothermia bacterium]|nr:SDR family oxidoreductase [Candidatus Acetothermia bacterium]
MDLGLKGKIAAVAAASQGLGKAIAQRLAQEGASVAICARTASDLKKTAEEIRKSTSARVLDIAVDLTEPQSAKEFIGRTVKEFGGLDILVTNSGGPSAGSFVQFSDSDWEKAFQLLIMSTVRLCREAIPHLQKSNAGRIINVTSTSVKQPIPNLLLSNALRPSVIGLAKSLALELAPYRIAVNSVCPGSTATQRLEEIFAARAKELGASSEEVRNYWLKDIPMGRFGKPEELAALVAFLASEHAGFITGVAVQADGGQVRGVF